MSKHALHLGRLVSHDPRSLAFPAPSAPIRKAVTHRHYGLILDQGQLGSCTGNAMAQALMTAPLHQKGRTLTEKDAVSIYSAATVIDGAPGQYPPDDTGSSGLAVAKVAKSRGLITGYTHAFGLDHALGALQLSPLLVGVNWHEAMFTPDAQGFVHPDGNVAGGHEFVCIGDTGSHLVFLNSWGKSWGRNGRFFMTYADFGTLLNEQGDVVVPAP
jgi:hypothetical protein